MLRALSAGKSGDLPWLLAGRAVRFSDRSADAAAGVAAVSLGPAAAWLGVFRVIRVSFPHRTLGLGIAAFLGLSCTGVRNAYRFGHRRTSAGVVSGLSGQASDVSRLWCAGDCCLYLPVFTGLTVVAWPGFEPANTGLGFLVNRFAYRAERPSQGQWIWMHPSKPGEPRAAQVVAISGQEVEWTGRSWKVDGKARSLHSPGRLTSLAAGLPLQGAPQQDPGRASG